MIFTWYGKNSEAEKQTTNKTEELASYVLNCYDLCSAAKQTLKCSHFYWNCFFALCILWDMKNDS